MKSIVAALLLSALLASPAAAQPRAKLKFVMPTPPATYLLPYFVAQDLGWYRNWGLEVTEQVISGDPNSLRVVVAGDSEVTLIGPPTIMEAVINGAKLRMFTSWQPVTDYMLIAGDKKAMTLKDLADKRIAVTGPGSMTMHIPQMLMLKAGVDTSQVKFLSVGGMAARLQSVAAGKVDATLVDTFFERLLSSSVTKSAARSMPRLRSIGFMPAATDFAPSRTIAWASTVAVVVPSPAVSDVRVATSRTIWAPMFSNLSESSISLATVTPSLVMRGAP